MTEGEDAKRDVWVLGFRDSDERPEKALGRVFGLDPLRARRLIASMPAVVKREVTAEQAEPIVAALRKIGARVALVPAGASSVPGAPRAAKPVEKVPAAPPAPAADSLGLGDIESAAIDFGPTGPPSSGSHPALRESLPYPRSASLAPEPARVSEAPPRPEPEPPPPAPVTFLEPRPIPEEPPRPPDVRTFGPLMLGAGAVAVGAGALFYASTLPGSLFGGAPDPVGTVVASVAIAALLFGVQALVGALAFGVAVSRAGAIAFAVVGAGAVGATGFFLHHVDPAEAARQERAATMAAIREGRLPEARLFLTEPACTLEGMDRPAAAAWVEALYTAGARQVYVTVDYDTDAHTANGVAIALPLTRARRDAVANAVRQQVAHPPADDGEWWLIPFD